LPSIYIEQFINVVLPRIGEIVSTLWLKPTILWAVTPLFITLLVMQIYFGRYRTEELGWNTAFGNAISLFWVSANLMRYLSENYTIQQLVSESELILKLIITFTIALWAIILTLFNFAHIIQKRISFIISSSRVVITTAIIITIIIIGNVPLDKITFVASVIIFLITILILTIIKRAITPSIGAKIGMKLHEKHIEEERKKKRERIKEKIKAKKEKFREFFKSVYDWFKVD